MANTGGAATTHAMTGWTGSQRAAGAAERCARTCIAAGLSRQTLLRTRTSESRRPGVAWIASPGGTIRQWAPCTHARVPRIGATPAWHFGLDRKHRPSSCGQSRIRPPLARRRIGSLRPEACAELGESLTKAGSTGSDSRRDPASRAACRARCFRPPAPISPIRSTANQRRQSLKSGASTPQPVIRVISRSRMA